ncbi:MAG: hypothetical protein U9R54_05065 [Bacteroidota bacterium]|nr:hypothetical protein [Bacteroidota bacterium]
MFANEACDARKKAEFTDVNEHFSGKRNKVSEHYGQALIKWID